MASKINFNELVAEARREAVEIDMPDGETLLVQFPTGEQAKAIRVCFEANDDDGCLLALFGQEQGKQLLESFKDVPADVPGRLVQAVMKEFGIAPNLMTSSN